MKKYKLLSIVLLFNVFVINAQIGINTEIARATLDVRVDPANTNFPEGLLVPAMRYSDLFNKTKATAEKPNAYGPDQNGAILRITHVDNITFPGPPSGPDATALQIISNIKEPGLYKFNYDATSPYWEPLEFYGSIGGGSGGGGGGSNPSEGAVWGLIGNSGTNPAINFLGTTDNNPLILKANNQDLIKLQNNAVRLKGNVQIFSNSGDNTSGIAYLQARDASGNSSIGLQLRTQNAGAIKDALLITSTGNVGIGNYDPQYLLDVRGSSRIANNRIEDRGVNINQFGSGNRLAYIDFETSDDKPTAFYNSRIIRNAGKYESLYFMNTGQDSNGVASDFAFQTFDDSNILLGGTRIEGRGIRLNKDGVGDKLAFIDFHSGPLSSGQIYSARIIQNGFSGRKGFNADLDFQISGGGSFKFNRPIFILGKMTASNGAEITGTTITNQLNLYGGGVNADGEIRSRSNFVAKENSFSNGFYVQRANGENITSISGGNIHTIGNIRSGAGIYPNVSQDTDTFINVEGDGRMVMRTNGQLRLVLSTGNGTKHASYDGDSNWDFPSDIRLKEDIEPAELVLNKINALKISRFNWKGEPKKSIKEFGVLAQDVEKYFPELVSQGEFDEKLGFKPKKVGLTTFGIIAIKGVQELNKILDEKDQKIEKLTSELELLKKEINLIKSKIK